MIDDNSNGSSATAFTSALIICALVVLLLRHYLPLRSTPAYILLPVFLGIALPWTIIVLVPVDLASADGPASKGIWLAESTVLLAWGITYWLTFFLTWWLLPLLGEYCDSGDRSIRGRLLYSIQSNARYYLILLGAGVAGLVYFILQNGLHVASIKAMVMALAYASGLILAIGLMGHGLVALPRRIFRNANIETRLRHLQTKAPRTKDSLDDATDDLAQLEYTVLQLRQRKNGASRDLQDWIDDLVDTTPAQNTRPGTSAAVQATNVTIPAVITERYLADMTRKLKRARHHKARFVSEWRNLCRNAEDAETIIDAKTSKSLEFSRKDGLTGRINMLTPALRYHVHANVVPYLRLGLAGLLTVASAILVWSEGD